MLAANAIDSRRTTLPPVPEPSDQELMLRLRRQDIRALELLFDRYHQIALGLACKIVRDRNAAEDIVQDVFLALWRQPDRFDPTKGTPRGWLLAIVHHRSIDKLRRTHGVQCSLELVPHIIDDAQADPCDAAADRVAATQLHSALATLPHEQRTAIELAFLHGRTHVEIASLLGCPLGTVKGRIRIGLAKLRATLTEGLPATA
ncbi:MAG: RNA polymerase subunit sigma-24 [Chloroflexi bacterium]|nr:MAG: RNA polymerase subunit sigma-24 [Chloroflexota bacterium]